jgi:hypothetical protein
MRLKILKLHLKENLTSHTEELEEMINYIAIWKEALIKALDISQSKMQVLKKLKTEGINKNYLTINQWYNGLYDDPVKSAVLSLITPNINIGPGDKKDILGFGRAFKNKKLIENYHQIFASMEIFRELNRQKGKHVMNDILNMVENEENRTNCIQFKVKGIRIINKSR